MADLWMSKYVCLCGCFCDVTTFTGGRRLYLIITYLCVIHASNNSNSTISVFDLECLRIDRGNKMISFLPYIIIFIYVERKGSCTGCKVSRESYRHKVTCMHTKLTKKLIIRQAFCYHKYMQSYTLLLIEWGCTTLLITYTLSVSIW